MPILTGGIINYGQRSANPTSPTPTEGSQYWHTTENTQYIYDGTNWNPVKVTLPWEQENNATHWWKSEGIQSKTLWNAQVGGVNLVPGHTDDLTYNSSDSGFNNNKTIDFNPNTGSDFGMLRTAYNDNAYWNASEPWSVIMVIEKFQHGSGSNLGDGLFVQGYNQTTSGSWSVDIAGDHTWGGSYGEQVGGISGYSNFSYSSSNTKKGIFCFRCDTSGGNTNYMFQEAGNNSFTTIATANALPSSLPGSGFDYLGVGNFNTTGASHEWGGTIAEIAYYKGVRVTDDELSRFSTYAKPKFSI